MGSKIIFVAMAMITLNVAFLIFSCSSWDPSTGECVAYTTNDTVEEPSLWSLAVSPEQAAETNFLKRFFGSNWGLAAALGVIASGTILVGTLVYGRSLETLVYFAMAIGLISTLYPAIRLHQFLMAFPYGDYLFKVVASILISATMVITVLFTVLDWARGRE
jgi:hypothetical protein